MKRIYPAGAIAIALLMTTFFFTTVRAQDGKPITEPERAQWEYMVLIPDEKGPDLHDERRMRLEKQLQTAGAQGWELVTIPYLKGVRYQVLVLKRLK